jgi:hypothetical protein
LGKKQPSIIFIHQLLDSFSGVSELVCVKNADEIVKILEVNKMFWQFSRGTTMPDIIVSGTAYIILQ